VSRGLIDTGTGGDKGKSTPTASEANLPSSVSGPMATRK
jgi:hypothetical protein